MLMAGIIWFLGLLGVAPTAADFDNYDTHFRERGHHMTLDFGGQRIGGTRWTDDDWSKSFTVGLGYEYLVDRRYNGVGFEVLFQSLGRYLDMDGGDNYFFLGGGISWYPIRHLRLFMMSGAYMYPYWDQKAEVVGRVGVGFRFMFFMLGMQPYVYAETTSTGQEGWGLMFRFEF